jgi:small conductance mechanosensitive channel
MWKQLEQLRASLGQRFSLRSILDWLLSHGLKIVLILVAVVVVLWIARLLQDRLVALLAGRSTRGLPEERENRARTLVSVLQNALRTVAIAVGVFMILEELSVPVGPLLGSAAVVGLAIAFGAQSLIKDYFSGFMILLEQQYLLGDVIKVGDITGSVERITMRVTVLRDLEGRVHFIPHGQIQIVTNLTQDWSQALFDVNIAYKEDVDRVTDVLMNLAGELKSDEKFGPMILGEPQMLGVENLGDAAVTIKFAIRTRPMKQWDVKRELLKRIKRRFGELGIDYRNASVTTFVQQPPAPQKTTT